MTKRILALLLCLALLVSVLPLPLTVSAAYENTHVNTGNQRYDIIQVALTQVGYQEGSKSYTKYGEYFGHPNTDWCGWFVSWCAAQAGVPNSVIRRQGIAKASSFGFSSTFTADEKLPQAGDLYFKSGHVGFVYKVQGNYFWTVEGNSGDQVEIEKLSLYSSRYWFVSPNYGGSNNASHTHTLATGNDTAHPHKEYTYCTSCDYKSYTGSVQYVADCTDCIQENCSHTYGDWETTGSSKHKQTCALCGKEVTAAHTWVDVELISEPTCGKAGSVSQKCKTCGATRTSTIAKTNNHVYGDWELTNDEKHSRKCTVCGKTVSKEHKVEDDAWQTTETEHWQECVTCQKQFNLAQHTFGDKCVDPCADCGYVRPEGHPFSDQWLTDEVNHWRACTLCSELSTLEEHTYSAECDEDCNTCGYVRQVEHSYSQQMQINSTAHWYECEVCGKVEGQEDHVPGPEATEENAQLCTVCLYELTPQIVHVHDFTPIYGDSEQHWGTCRCGLELGPELHTWDLTTGACSVCGAVSEAQAQEQNWEFVWYILIGVTLCAGIVTVCIIAGKARKRKKMHTEPYWD